MNANVMRVASVPILLHKRVTILSFAIKIYEGFCVHVRPMQVPEMLAVIALAGMLRSPLTRIPEARLCVNFVGDLGVLVISLTVFGPILHII